jgi:hypothetical protein
MSAKPMTAAAAIMASNANRQNAPSPTPAPATKTLGSQGSLLTELEPELPVESLKVDSLVRTLPSACLSISGFVLTKMGCIDSFGSY